MPLEDLFLHPHNLSLGDILSYVKNGHITPGECADIIEEQILKKYSLNPEIFEHLYNQSDDLKEYCHRLLNWEQDHR